jgi:hypothetical protein
VTLVSGVAIVSASEFAGGGEPVVHAAYLDAESQPFNGTVASTWAGGTGAQATPYLIDTAERLVYWRNYAGGKNNWFKLTKNIVLNDPNKCGGWQNWNSSTPSVTSGAPNSSQLFNWWSSNEPLYNTLAESSSYNELDGDGHEIIGLFINTAATTQSTALNVGFSNRMKNGQFFQLGLQYGAICVSYPNATAANTVNVGSFTGEIYGYGVTKCYSGLNIRVTGRTTADALRVGGIVGNTDFTKGANLYADINSCSFWGDILVTGSAKTLHLGGIVARFDKGGQISGCDFAGTITDRLTYVATSKNAWIGGIAGTLEGHGPSASYWHLTTCRSTGWIRTRQYFTYVGGLVGAAYGQNDATGEGYNPWITNNYTLAKICYDSNGNTVTSNSTYGYAGVVCGRIGGRLTTSAAESGASTAYYYMHNMYNSVVCGGIPAVNYHKGSDTAPTTYARGKKSDFWAINDPTATDYPLPDGGGSYTVKYVLGYNCGYDRFYHNNWGTLKRGNNHVTWSWVEQSKAQKFGGTVTTFPKEKHYIMQNAYPRILGTETIEVTFDLSALSQPNQTVWLRKGERLWSPINLPTITGKHVTWRKNNVNYTNFGIERMDSNTTFVATVTDVTYSVAYNANGGSGSMGTQGATYGTSLVLSNNNFTWVQNSTTYTFKGWTDVNHKGMTHSALSAVAKRTAPTDQTGTKGTFLSNTDPGFYFDAADAPISVINLTATQGATVTLYAVWERNACVITFSATPPPNASQTSFGSAMSDQIVDRNQSPNLNNCTYNLTGWVFVGWTLAAYKDMPQNETLVGWNQIPEGSKWTNQQSIPATVTNELNALVLLPIF